MTKKPKTKKNFLGAYSTDKGENVVGELKLDGAKTLLSLHSDNQLRDFEEAYTIKGLGYSGERLTLVDCRSAGSSTTFFSSERQGHRTDIFPHYVIKGREFLDPDSENISAVHFTTNDLFYLFHDFDAFGHVIDSTSVIDAVLKEKKTSREIATGENPQVFYYTGKSCIADVDTVIGKITVHHRPTYGLGGPKGVAIENKIVVGIETLKPVPFHVAMSHVYKIANFLSVLAGRVQGINDVQISTTKLVMDFPTTLQVFESYRWKAKDKTDSHKPVVGDIPLDPVRRKTEFETVLRVWVEKHDKWQRARNRNLVCLGKLNKYNIDRLVAAANMFDILPEDATPIKSEPETEFLETIAEFKQKLRKHSESVDRNSVLNSLGRVGKPSLPKKVSYRASIIDKSIGRAFPLLEFVANVAVKIRNYYVHGSSGELDFERVEPFVPFLTDTLEFVFSASDLIESGWDAQSWSENHYGWGHSFTRFRVNYLETLQRLQEATKKKSA
ncbi:hypothetical protein QS468_29520 [Bacillus subtilis]|nr:HEPN domain-containing protein [Pseudomonas sp. A29(2023)]MDL5596889.1 hypothetical protein [Bacillus subtilis]